MAEVRIEHIIEHLDHDIRRALEDAVSRVLPGATVDCSELYRELRNAVGRKSTTWVKVPGTDVKKTCQACGADA